MKNYIDMLRKTALEGKGIPISYTPASIFGLKGSPSTQDPGCRYVDCPMGRLVARAMMNTKQCQDAHCDVARINAGSIRASIPAGNITREQVENVLPFTNHATTKELTGLQVRSHTLIELTHT